MGLCGAYDGDPLGSCWIMDKMREMTWWASRTTTYFRQYGAVISDTKNRVYYWPLIITTALIRPSKQICSSERLSGGKSCVMNGHFPRLNYMLNETPMIPWCVMSCSFSKVFPAIKKRWEECIDQTLLEPSSPPHGRVEPEVESLGFFS